MSHDWGFQHDCRCVDELFNAALGGGHEEAAWNAISALHRNGTGEVLKRAAVLSRSECPRERQVAADVLGQLGVPVRAFPEESVALLLKMIDRENDPGVLQSILVAFSHFHDPRGIPIAARSAKHPDADVRHAAALALTGHEDKLAIASLIGLTCDPEPHVRDWATFGLGTQSGANSPEICDALAARLSDSDFDTRSEAIAGLAARKDSRVVPALRRELRSDCVGTVAVEAALEIGDKELYGPLSALRGWWDVDPILLERALAACNPT